MSRKGFKQNNQVQNNTISMETHQRYKDELRQMEDFLTEYEYQQDTVSEETHNRVKSEIMDLTSIIETNNLSTDFLFWKLDRPEEVQ